MLEWNSIIVAPVSEMLTRLVGYLPTLIGALIILTVGWVIAKALRRIVNRALEAIHFDKLADKAGISEILSKGGLKTSAINVMSGLVYWLAIIMVLVMVAQFLFQLVLGLAILGEKLMLLLLVILLSLVRSVMLLTLFLLVGVTMFLGVILLHLL